MSDGSIFIDLDQYSTTYMFMYYRVGYSGVYYNFLTVGLSFDLSWVVLRAGGAYVTGNRLVRKNWIADPMIYGISWFGKIKT